MGVPGLAQLWAALPAEVRGNLDKVILATTAKGQVFDRPEPCFDLSAAFYDHLRSSALKLDADSLLTIALHCHGDESVGKATLQAALLPIFVSITEVSCWSCVKGVAVWGSVWLLFLFSFAKQNENKKTQTKKAKTRKQKRNRVVLVCPCAGVLAAPSMGRGLLCTALHQAAQGQEPHRTRGAHLC